MLGAGNPKETSTMYAIKLCVQPNLSLFTFSFSYRGVLYSNATLQELAVHLVDHLFEHEPLVSAQLTHSQDAGALRPYIDETRLPSEVQDKPLAKTLMLDEFTIFMDFVRGAVKEKLAETA